MLRILSTFLRGCWKFTSDIWVNRIIVFLFNSLGWIQCVKGLEEHLNYHHVQFPCGIKKNASIVFCKRSVCNSQGCPDCKTICWFVGEGLRHEVHHFQSSLPCGAESVSSRWVWPRTESTKSLKMRSCKLLNGIFSIYAVYLCPWVGENDQANKKFSWTVLCWAYLRICSWSALLRVYLAKSHGTHPGGVYNKGTSCSLTVLPYNFTAASSMCWSHLE